MEHRRRIVLVLLAASAVGCEGVIADPGSSPTPEDPTPSVDQCIGVIDAPETGWGLLDPIEYEHAIETILGEDVSIAGELDEHMGSHVTLLGAERLNTVAETVITEHELGGCTDDACAEGFLLAMAERAFRRAPTADERAFVTGRYADARAAGQDVRRSMETVAQIVLQAPQTMYTPVLGAPGPDGLIQLSADELATRMALFLWKGVPDAELREAAVGGALDTAEGVAEQAGRMLDHPRAGVALGRLIVGWLGLEGGPTLDPLAIAAKDADRYPEMSDSLRAAMQREVEMLLTRMVREGGTVAELFTTRDAYVNGELAALYGVDAPAEGEGWVTLPEGERSGLLTRAAFLATYAGPDVRSPIRRGVFVLEEVLCRTIAEPPPNANDVPVTGGTGEGGEVRSVREDVIARTRGGVCADCHDAINPVGFLFDRYDAIGRYALEETIEVDGDSYVFDRDSSGSVMGESFGDALELSEHLAESETVRSCLAERFFEHAVGRHVTPKDACGLAPAREELVERGDLREALIAIVTAESFRYARQATTTPEEESR